jgi:hypothetical protein
VIHYHGTPITPRAKLLQLAGRCFCVSFAHPYDVTACHEIGQAVMLDNGAFSLWRVGRPVDWPAYYAWCEPWLQYRTTWAVIPDVIDGTTRENDALLDAWPFGGRGAPVWHLQHREPRLASANGYGDGRALRRRPYPGVAAHAPRAPSRRQPLPVRLSRQHERRA